MASAMASASPGGTVMPQFASATGSFIEFVPQTIGLAHVAYSKSLLRLVPYLYKFDFFIDIRVISILLSNCGIVSLGIGIWKLMLFSPQLWAVAFTPSFSGPSPTSKK